MKEYTLTVIVEDSISKRGKALGLEAKHGLSLLLERNKPRTSILMDTGQSSNILLYNMNLLEIDLDKLDIVFLSHGHYDHTGGLLGILRKNLKKKIPIIAHPAAFKPKFKMDPHLRFIGCPTKSYQLEQQVSILLARNPTMIADGIMTTGEIQRLTKHEKPQGFWTVKNHSFVEDIMIDDQALIINIIGKGLVILSGCAHSGIINTVFHAQKLMCERKIHAIIGGFHLEKSSKETFNKTLDNLIKINPALICPCHCTGSTNINKLIKSFRRKCKPLKTGDILEINS